MCPSGVIQYSCGDACCSADKSSWAAELAALENFVRAASSMEADVSADILIDNLSVQKQFAVLCAGGQSLPRFGFGRWSSCVQLISGMDHSSFWVPSHGKKMNEWQAPPPHSHCTEKWRRVNQAADTQATLYLDRARKQAQHTRINAETKRAYRWAEQNLAALRKRSIDYIRSACDAGLSRHPFARLVWDPMKYNGPLSVPA